MPKSRSRKTFKVINGTKTVFRMQVSFNIPLDWVVVVIAGLDKTIEVTEELVDTQLREVLFDVGTSYFTDEISPPRDEFTEDEFMVAKRIALSVFPDYKAKKAE